MRGLNIKREQSGGQGPGITNKGLDLEEDLGPELRDKGLDYRLGVWGFGISDWVLGL